MNSSSDPRALVGMPLASLSYLLLDRPTPPLQVPMSLADTLLARAVISQSKDTLVNVAM